MVMPWLSIQTSFFWSSLSFQIIYFWLIYFIKYKWSTYGWGSGPVTYTMLSYRFEKVFVRNTLTLTYNGGKTTYRKLKSVIWLGSIWQSATTKMRAWTIGTYHMFGNKVMLILHSSVTFFSVYVFCVLYNKLIPIDWSVCIIGGNGSYTLGRNNS